MSLQICFITAHTYVSLSFMAHERLSPNWSHTQSVGNMSLCCRGELCVLSARVHVWTHMYACLCFCLCVFMVKKTAEARKSIKFPTPPGTHRSSPVSTATGKADLKEPMAHCISKTTKRPSQHLSTQPSAPSVRR